MEEIINRVAKSKLKTFDLEEVYPEGKRVLFDIKDWLFQEQILKEKDFRASVKNHDWSQYKNSFIAITCSVDAIIPSWAFMLVAAEVNLHAKKVIVVGSNEVKKPIEKIVEYLEEPLTYKEFNRKSKLSVGNQSKMNAMLTPNSAVIAFSKRDLYSLKSHYESLGNKVSIIYGKLPPAVKISESNKFRNGETEVLVSTDAIGMGLNLPIKNIYFNEIEKYNGYDVEMLESTLVKQIAGRAGRYGKFEEGVVSSFSKKNNKFIASCLNENTDMTYPNFSAKINESIFNELLRINERRVVSEIVELSSFVSFDITRIKNNDNYAEISNIIGSRANMFTNSEIVKLLNAPINNHKNDIYIRAFKLIFSCLVSNKNKILKKNIFNNLYNKIISRLNFNTAESEYALLDLFHFFIFNFNEFSSLETIIKDRKKEVSVSVMYNLSCNINEDDMNYYSGY